VTAFLDSSVGRAVDC